MFFQRRVSRLILLGLLVIGWQPLAAQDEPIPPPTETVIPTLPPTETATELPSATPLPTETPTALPTLTETPLPTATETETPLPLPTASETATATALPTASETATLMASETPSATGTAIISETPVQYAPTITPNPHDTLGNFAVQSLSAGIVYEVNVTNVTEFMAALNAANSDCSNTYVIYLAAGPYTVMPIETRGLIISGKVVLVGNHLSPSAIDPTVPDSNKVIFTSGVSNTGIFFINNGCASLTLYNVVLKGNSLPATFSGGAITNQYTLHIYNSHFLMNRAEGWGGAIFSVNSNSSPTSVSIINSVFESNRSTGNYLNSGGGAIATQYGSSLSIKCSTFKNNDSRNVGGVFYFFPDSGTITLQHLSGGNVDNTLSNNFLSNTATNGWGSIYNLSSTIVNADNQYWNPAASSTKNNVNSAFGATFSSALGSAVEPNPAPGNCIIPAIPSSVTWSANGTVFIVPDQPIPPLQKYYEPCDDAFRQTQEAKRSASRVQCAVDTYQRYVNKFGGSLTWEQIVSLLMYEEGNSILLGNWHGGQYVVGNPQSQNKGTCFNNSDAPNSNGYPQTSSAAQCTPLQNNFTYAAVELLYNKCAFGNYSNYQGTCTEKSLFEFAGDPKNPGYLASSQGLFDDPYDDENNDGDVLDANIYAYLSIARARLNQFAYTSPNVPGNPNWGICPCGWENIELLLDPKPYGTRWTFSYYQTALDYFRIYGPK